MKKTALFLVFTMICLCLAGCTTGTQNPTEVHTDTTTTGNFTVDFLDVGKADAMLLRTENHNILLDTGEAKDGKPIKKYLDSLGITKLDYVVITHFDQDHVGGFPKIINKFEVGQVLYPNYEGNNPEYEKFVKEMADNSRTDEAMSGNLTFTLDDTSFIVYPPEKTYYEEDDNDYSIVISAKHGENTYLFTGDAEQARIAEILRIGNLEHTVLKVPYHGRESANSKMLIDAVKPKYAVISSNMGTVEDNIVKYLENVGAEVYQTYEGSIEMISDGKTITVNNIEYSS